MKTEIRFNKEEMKLIKSLCEIYLNNNRGILLIDNEINVENLYEDLKKLEVNQ